VSTRAASIPTVRGTERPRRPDWVPEPVLRSCAEYDWRAVLPPHARTRRWHLERGVKRACDIVAAATALVVLAPLLALIALLIKATSRGPVLYEWRVLGERGRPFVGYKFRTMVADADSRKAAIVAHNELNGPAFKMKADPRITRVGRILRKYSLDELPQLWSVVAGDMSLVGPRPVYPSELAGFEPWQLAKLAVTPGITCLWQVSGRSEIRDFDRWVHLDLDYIANWSLGLDLRILARTVPAVLSGRGAY
jgi:lipopolysaccharide/colanic/teichoic acid biosynthesis glycosyltransferase